MLFFLQPNEPYAPENLRTLYHPENFVSDVCLARCAYYELPQSKKTWDTIHRWILTLEIRCASPLMIMRREIRSSPCLSWKEQCSLTPAIFKGYDEIFPLIAFHPYLPLLSSPYFPISITIYTNRNKNRPIPTSRLIVELL